MACTHLANMVGHCLCSAGAACRPAAWLLVPEMDAIGRRRQAPHSLLCWELACVQHVDVNAATKTWIYFYALARVHCSNCCSHFKNSNTAGKAVWKILIIRLVSRPPTASPSPPHASLNLLPLAPYLCALQSKRHLPPSSLRSLDTAHISCSTQPELSFNNSVHLYINNQSMQWLR